MATKYTLSQQARSAFNAHGVTSFVLDQKELDSSLVYIDTAELYGMQFPHTLWTRVPTQQSTDEGLVAKVSLAAKSYKGLPKNPDRLMKTGDNLEGVLFDFDSLTVPQFSCCQDYISPVYRDVAYSFSEAEEAKFHKKGVIAINPNSLRDSPLNAMSIVLPDSLIENEQTVYVWTKHGDKKFPKIMIGRENMNTPGNKPIGLYTASSPTIKVNFYWRHNEVSMPYLDADFTGGKKMVAPDLLFGQDRKDQLE